MTVPRLLFALWLTAAVAPAAWLEVRLGPFVVLSEAGATQARDAATHLEQFRHALGQAFGRQELELPWPVTIVVLRQDREAPFFDFSRDGWMGTWPSRGAPPAAWFRRLAEIFLEHNLKGRMPEGFEEALAEAYSTLEVDGVRLIFGAPPQSEARTLAWALIHQLTTTPETSGRVRVLLSNLANGAEEGPAYRNAFQTDKRELEARAREYLAYGQFATTRLNAKPIDARRLTAREALPSRIRALPGDLALARRQFEEARLAYQDGLNQRPAAALHEGLGLALLGLNDPANAKPALEKAAADTENAGARALYELARLEPDHSKARAFVERATQANPAWPDPFILAAEQEAGPVRRAHFLLKATELAPRRIDLWQRLAEAQLEAKQFDEATKSWSAAGRAAPNDEERQRIIAARRAADVARIEAAEEEKRRRQREAQEEIDRLRREAEERIRAAEAKADAAAGEYKPTRKIEAWWDGPETKSLTGVLERVDCLRGSARLHLKLDAGGAAQLMVPNPRKVVIFGTGEAVLGCGPQRPPRGVKIEYLPQSGARAPVLGEAVTIEFR